MEAPEVDDDLSLVFLSAGALLAGAALGASWLPARRAAAVEPVETLTSD